MTKNVLLNYITSLLFYYREFKPYRFVSNQGVGANMGTRVHQPQLLEMGPTAGPGPGVCQQHRTTHYYELIPYYDECIILLCLCIVILGVNP